jgi:hypothetical protein
MENREIELLEAILVELRILNGTAVKQQEASQARMQEAQKMMDVAKNMLPPEMRGVLDGQ